MIASRAKALAAIAPMAHQSASLKHDSKTPFVFDASDPGTGKTAVRIWAFAGRRRKRGGCLLVLAPRSLLRSAWANDLARFAPDLTVSVATAANRAEAFATPADVYVTNHDAVKELLKLPKAYWSKFDELVVDESDAYKNHTSQRSRAVRKLSTYFKRRACLSATPTSNGICDIWHPAYLLDGGQRLGREFYGFRNTVCIPHRKSRSNPHAIEWEDKVGAEEAVFGLLADIVIRHKRDDCMDIPATQYNTVEFELAPKVRAAYDKMQNTMLLPLMGGALSAAVAAKMAGKPPPMLTAVNAAAVATKLLQIASGAVYDGTGEGKYMVIDRSRYETLMEMASVRKHPLIFFFWQHQRDLLVEEAEKRGMTYAVLDGNTSDAERVGIVARYQLGAYDALFGHPKTVAHGYTMTKGTSILWPGPTYDLSWFVQGNGRQARIGQTQKTEVVVMLGKDTIEEQIYNQILMPKNKRMSNLLELFASMTTPVVKAGARAKKAVAA